MHWKLTPKILPAQDSDLQSLKWIDESDNRINRIIAQKKPEKCKIAIVDETVNTCCEIIEIISKVSPLVKNSYIKLFQETTSNKVGLQLQYISETTELYGIGKDLFKLAEKISRLILSVVNIKKLILSAKHLASMRTTTSIKYITECISTTGKELYLDFRLLNELIKAKTGSSDLLAKAKKMFPWL